MSGFYIILIRKKLWRFEIKGPILFFWTEWNFNKNETESKMENSTLRETNLTLKNHESIIISWNLRKRLFCYKEIFCSLCVLSQCIENEINFQNIYTFIFVKRLVPTHFCLFLILSKFFSIPWNILLKYLFPKVYP